MFIFRIKKDKPLQIISEKTGEILEVHCPKDNKNTGIVIGLKLPKDYKILHSKQVEDLNDSTDDLNYNK